MTDDFCPSVFSPCRRTGGGESSSGPSLSPISPAFLFNRRAEYRWSCIWALADASSGSGRSARTAYAYMYSRMLAPSWQRSSKCSAYGHDGGLHLTTSFASISNLLIQPRRMHGQSGCSYDNSRSHMSSSSSGGGGCSRDDHSTNSRHGVLWSVLYSMAFPTMARRMRHPHCCHLGCTTRDDPPEYRSTP